MPSKEPRPHQIVYLKTVSVQGIIDDEDPKLLKISTDNGESWSHIHKDYVISAIPLR